MEEKGRNKKRNRIILIATVCLIVAGVIGIFVGCSCSKNESGDDGTAETVTRRDIATSVSASGVVDATDSEDLVSPTIGTKITKLYVKTGDTVTPGQVIAQLDTTALQQQYAEMQKNISQAKADQLKTNQEYDKQIAKSQSERDAEINEIRQELSSAQSEYDSTSSELNRQRRKYAQYLADPEHSEWDEEAIGMDSNISTLELSLAVAENKKEIYQNALDSEQAVEDNQEEVDDFRNSINETSDSTIKSMEDAAREIQKSISEATVRTSIGGIVTNVPVKVGDTYLGGTIATVENANSFLIDAEISEYDVADVSAGMKVKIKTDATRDEELTGVVTFVAPRANSTAASSTTGALSEMMGGAGAGSTITSTVGSSAMYRVKVALDQQNPRLRLGMNAKLSILTSEAMNTLAVPYEAVQEEEDGTKFVEIITNMDKVEEDYTTPYEKEKVKVDVGVMGTYYTEIHGTGIAEGTYVYIPADTGTDSVAEIMKRMGANTGV